MQKVNWISQNSIVFKFSNQISLYRLLGLAQTYRELACHCHPYNKRKKLNRLQIRFFLNSRENWSGKEKNSPNIWRKRSISREKQDTAICLPGLDATKCHISQ